MLNFEVSPARASSPQHQRCLVASFVERGICTGCETASLLSRASAMFWHSVDWTVMYNAERDFP